MRKNQINRKNKPSHRSRRFLKNLFGRFFWYLLPLYLIFCCVDYALPHQTQALRSWAESRISDAEFLLTGETSKSEPFSKGSENYDVSDFEVHFLDVGQGLSVFVRSGEQTLLYDGGDRDTSSFVVAYLKQQQVESLDYVIASHYDADHLNGLIGALHVFPAETIMGPDYPHESDTFDSFCQAVESQEKEVIHPSPGDCFPLGKGFFTVLAPEKEYEDSNNNSIVLRLVCGDTSFLLTGDAEAESEEDMCFSGMDLSSDVLCAGHHGSSTATTDLFLSVVQPAYGIISAGKNNEYGHPHSETLQRLKAHDAEVLQTSRLGTIVFSSDGNTLTWSSFR